MALGPLEGYDCSGFEEATTVVAGAVASVWRGIGAGIGAVVAATCGDVARGSGRGDISQVSVGLGWCRLSGVSSCVRAILSRMACSSRTCPAWTARIAKPRIKVSRDKPGKATGCRHQGAASLRRWVIGQRDMGNLR